MSGWFDKAIARGVAKGIDNALADYAKPGGKLKRIVRDAMDDFIRTKLRELAEENKPVIGALDPSPFAWQMAMHFLRTDKTMDPFAARDLAFATLREFLATEGIRYGDPAYSWDQSAAVDVATEMETDHWESAA